MAKSTRVETVRIRANKLVVHTNSTYSTEYQFRVEYRQTMQATTIPIVHLVTSIQDMTAAIRHSEINIEFPVKAGFTHRIHYDETEKGFSVSLGVVSQSAKASTLHADDNAVQGIYGPDQSEDFGCALLSEPVEP